MDELTLRLIKEKEGYSSTAYWDVTAWRVGYGSDTVTDADGTVRKVTKATTTTPDAAERDLARRVPEFQKSGVIAYVGKKAWDNLSPAAQASVTSLAYNYGSLKGLKTIQRAIKGGSENVLAKAIEARGRDNAGINSKRRADEAALIRANPKAPTPLTRPDTVKPTARDNIAAQRTEQQQLRNGGKPLAAPAPLTFGKPATILAGASAAKAAPKAPVAGLKLPVAPSARDTAVAARQAKSAVAASGKTVAQVGQEADAARLNGYRSIQEMGPSSKGAKSNPVATPVVVKKPGVIKTTAPDQEPIPRGVVPKSVQTPLNTPKAPVEGLIQLRPGQAPASALTPGAAAKDSRIAAGAAAAQKGAAARVAADRAAAQQAAAAAAAKAQAQQAAAARAAQARQQAAAAAAARAAAMRAVQFQSNGVANPAYRDYSSNGTSDGGGALPANAFGGNGGGGFTDSLGGRYYDRHL